MCQNCLSLSISISKSRKIFTLVNCLAHPMSTKAAGIRKKWPANDRLPGPKSLSKNGHLLFNPVLAFPFHYIYVWSYVSAFSCAASLYALVLSRAFYPGHGCFNGCKRTAVCRNRRGKLAFDFCIKAIIPFL